MASVHPASGHIKPKSMNRKKNSRKNRPQTISYVKKEAEEVFDIFCSRNKPCSAPNSFSSQVRHSTTKKDRDKIIEIIHGQSIDIIGDSERDDEEKINDQNKKKKKSLFKRLKERLIAMNKKHPVKSYPDSNQNNNNDNNDKNKKNKKKSFFQSFRQKKKSKDNIPSIKQSKSSTDDFLENSTTTSIERKSRSETPTTPINHGDVLELFRIRNECCATGETKPRNSGGYVCDGVEDDGTSVDKLPAILIGAAVTVEGDEDNGVEEEGVPNKQNKSQVYEDVAERLKRISEEALKLHESSSSSSVSDLVRQVTQNLAYQQFSDGVNQFIRQFNDPIMIQVALTFTITERAMNYVGLNSRNAQIIRDHFFRYFGVNFAPQLAQEGGLTHLVEEVDINDPGSN